MIPPKTVTLCLLQEAGKILLGMKKRGFGAGRWNGFGGKPMEGESIEDAARREVLEECGLTIGPLTPRAILDFTFEGNPQILRVHLFGATSYTGTPQETEEMRPAWFSIDKIPFDTMWPDDRLWFPLFLSGQNFRGKFSFDAAERMTAHAITPVTGTPEP